MRPVPARVSDLQRRLAAERLALIQVEARVDGAIEGPALDLVATEAQLAIVEDRLDQCAEAALVIDGQLVEARAAVRELERAAVRLAARIADANIDREAAIERRLATVLAYHPERRSEVLFDPTPKAADAETASS